MFYIGVGGLLLFYYSYRTAMFSRVTALELRKYLDNVLYAHKKLLELAGIDRRFIEVARIVGLKIAKHL
jgi:hypothetical protein